MSYGRYFQCGIGTAELLWRRLDRERRDRRGVRRLVRRDRVLVLQRERDVVEPFEQARAREVVELEREAAGGARLEVDRQLARRRAARSISSFTCSAGSSTGSRPILSEFWRKMSPNDGATIASKP